MALRRSSQIRDSAATPVTDRLGAVDCRRPGGLRSETSPNQTPPGRFTGGGIPRRVGGVPEKRLGDSSVWQALWPRL